MPQLTRRQLLAAGLGAAGSLAAGGGLAGRLWPLLGREDLVPGAAPDLALPATAWSTTADRLTFAAVGDTGSGGRQAMAVADRMARGYQASPYGLVTHLGDLCYYGRVEDRFDDVFVRPMRPLIDAGVRFELAIGNHDGDLHHSDESLAEIDAELRLLGTPARTYTTSHGPVDFFYLDSSAPGLFGADATAQVEWLDDALASSANQWKVVCLHHPLFSSGSHGSTPGARNVLGPVFARRSVDLVLSGHDHHYERTRPVDGVTYVVSGGGCKTTPVGRSRFTAAAASALQYLHVDVAGDRLTGRSVRADGVVLDRFELRAREGR
ncbi:metallophosphoesterase family protein [Geodermatophilus chilensis]|uniref:metallophosphoesterase family protein n=1 Tax=Geodermatophilus chilensis TaxID=2035835 RepID=UPI000C25B153|nr:metallophosphoesterase [Geodermatophilus chilensis]